MADEVQAELTLDQELEALKTPAAAVPPVPDSAPETPSVVPPSGEPAAEVNPLEEQLKAIPDEAPVETPKLPEAQQKILDTFTTPEAAQEAAKHSGWWVEFSGNVASGDFAKVEQAFTPESLEAFKDYMYEKYVASGDWVDRWIAEKEGTAPVHSGIKQLQAQISALQAERQKERQQGQTQQQQQRNTETNKAFTSYLDGLFNQINFSPADRKPVAALFTTAIAQDPTAMSAYQNRSFAQLNKIFKTTVTEYVQRDKQITEKTEKTVAAQEARKPLPQGSAITPTGPITDEQIKSAPKEKRAALYDRQMDEQLAALARRK